MPLLFRIALAGALLLLSAASAASGVSSACVAGFDSYRQARVAQGVPDKHLPTFLPALAPGAEVNTVVLIHGLFESPHFLRGIAAEFRDAGHNVLSILLPGQWEADRSIADRITYRDWIDELDQAVAISSCMGSRVIFAGHSVGGMLALVGALRYPRHSAGLALWAPALQLRALPTLAGVVGSVLQVDGNLFTGHRPDADESARLAPNLALQGYALAQWAAVTFGEPGSAIEELRRSEPVSLFHSGVYRKVAVPAIIVVADNDPAVSTNEVRRLYREIGGRKALIEYGSGPVWHGNLLKSQVDTYRRAPRDFNPSFAQMAHDVAAFFAHR